MALGQDASTLRPTFADLDEKTWNNFLEELLNRENYNFGREIECSGEMVGPDWNHCLEYEFQLRKEALRLIRDQGVSIQQALWPAYADPQHRMKHWIMFLTVANLGSQSSQALMDEVALLPKEVVVLRSQRSRSPRSETATRLEGQAIAERAKDVVKVVARARTTPKEARVQHTTPKGRTSLMSSSRSTRTPLGTRKRTANQVFVGGSRRNSAKTQRSATENTYALAALVQGFRTTTVCVLNQSSERPASAELRGACAAPSPVAREPLISGPSPAGLGIWRSQR